MLFRSPQAARFKAAMDDDFNTSEAVAVLFNLANEVNKDNSIQAASLLKNLGGVIGLLQRNPDSYLQGFYLVHGSYSSSNTVEASNELIDERIQNRIEAKKSKNFAEADRIRKELADAGIILEDSPQGTTWRRA